MTYNASGAVTSDTTSTGRQDWDITANTITFTGYRPDGTARPSSFENYTRVGEDLVLMGSRPVLVIYHVRSLTATNFTIESEYYSTLNPSSARTATSYMPFHR